jgi:hypothetical protein
MLQPRTQAQKNKKDRNTTVFLYGSVIEMNCGSAWGRRKRFTVFTRLSAAALFKFSVSQHFFAVGSGSMFGFELEKEKENKRKRRLYF